MQFIATFAVIIAIALSFWFPVLGWIPIAVVDSLLVATVLSMRTTSFAAIPELSIDANRMIRRFGWYYRHPFAGRSYSAACSALALGGFLVGVVALYHRWWWSILIAVGNCVITAPLARKFNPSLFLQDEVERSAHQEVIDHILGKKHNHET